jgi:hypothetical protein
VQQVDRTHEDWRAEDDDLAQELWHEMLLLRDDTAGDVLFMTLAREHSSRLLCVHRQK